MAAIAYLSTEQKRDTGRIAVEPMTGILAEYSAWKARADAPVLEEPRTRSYRASVVDSG